MNCVECGQPVDSPVERRIELTDGPYVIHVTIGEPKFSGEGDVALIKPAQVCRGCIRRVVEHAARHGSLVLYQKI